MNIKRYSYLIYHYYCSGTVTQRGLDLLKTTKTGIYCQLKLPQNQNILRKAPSVQKKAESTLSAVANQEGQGKKGKRTTYPDTTQGSAC